MNANIYGKKIDHSNGVPTSSIGKAVNLLIEWSIVMINWLPYTSTASSSEKLFKIKDAGDCWEIKGCCCCCGSVACWLVRNAMELRESCPYACSTSPSLDSKNSTGSPSCSLASKGMLLMIEPQTRATGMKHSKNLPHANVCCYGGQHLMKGEDGTRRKQKRFEYKIKKIVH